MRPSWEAAIELRHLRYFIAVAERLNFSRAALDLATAQPSLSQQIRQLEAEIGVELFARGKRQIALTPAGVEFLTEARQIVARVGQAVAHAREAGRGLRGELRLGFTLSALMTTLPAAIRDYRAGHPDVRIALRALGSAELMAALTERQIDAGLLLARRAPAPSAALDVRRLGVLDIGVMLPAGHRLAGRDAIAVDDLASETLILYGRRLIELYDVVLELFRSRDLTPRRVEEVERIETIAGLVAADEGVSVVPRIYEQLHFPGVAYAALVPAPEPFTLAVVRGTTGNRALTAAFADVCERVAR